jgi:hypothetical protein
MSNDHRFNQSIIHVSNFSSQSIHYWQNKCNVLANPKPAQKRKKQQNLLLEKKKKCDFEKDPSDDSHQNNFFFTPRMIVAGIQNIVMVVGFVSY